MKAQLTRVIAAASFLVAVCGNAVASGNDNFSNRLTLLSSFLTNTVTGGNQGATKETGEPDHAGNPGGHSVWWTWTAPVSSDATFDTIGSPFDTLLAIYTGSSVSSLSNVASDDDSGGNKTSKLTFAAIAGTTYQIAVDGWGGATGNFVLHLRVAAASPVITGQPQSQTVLAGNAVAFNVSGTGSAPLSFAWRKNGTAIPGATNATYSIAIAQAGDAGTYTVAMANAAGNATSSNAILTVFPLLPPNDSFANRTSINGTNVTVLGSNINATSEPGETNHLGVPGGKSVWWSWTAPANCAVYVNASGSSFSVLLAVYTGNSVSGLTPVSNNGFFVAVAGTQYQIAVDGVYGASGVISLKLRTASLANNDAFENRSIISGTTNTVTGSNFNATKEPGEPNHAGEAGGMSVWWSWIAPTNGTVLLDTSGSGAFGLVIGVYTGNSVSNLTFVASGFGYAGPISFSAVAGIQYQIAVDDFFGDPGFIELNLKLVPFPPNDNFSNRSLISGLSNSVTGYTLGATRESGEPIIDISAAGNSVWWTWTAPANLAMGIDAFGSSFSVAFAVYTGSSVSQLTPVPLTYSGLGYPIFSSIAGVDYQIALDGISDRLATGNVELNLRPVPPPINDAFADRSRISGMAFNAYFANNLNATEEPGEPNRAGAAGRSVWWTWSAPSNSAVVIDTFDSDFVTPLDTLIAVYTGNAVSNLTLVTEARATRPGKVTFDATAGTIYQIAVDAWGDVGGRFSLELSALPFAVNDAFSNRIPIIGLTNTNTGNNASATSELAEPDHAGHSGGKSVWWTWTPLTNSTITLNTIGSAIDTALAVYTGNSVSNLTTVASGFGNEQDQITFSALAGTSYQIAVDSWNSTGGDIVLNIREVQRPQNDAFTYRLPITGLTGTVIGSNTFATKEAGEPDHAGNSGGKSVWWRWIAPLDTVVTLDTIGSSFDTLLAVYTGNSVSNLTLLVNDDQTGGGDASKLSFSAVAGTAYQIAVDGFSGDFGTIVLNLSTGFPPPNDLFANRSVIVGLTNTVGGSNVNATREPGEPNISQYYYHIGNVGGRSVWWTWTAPTNAIVTVDTFGSSFDTLLGVYTGTSFSELEFVFGSFYNAVSNTFAASAGTSYQIAVDGYGATSGSITLHVTAVPIPPPPPPPPPPPNDAFANAVFLTGMTNVVTGSNLGATKETGEPDHGNEPGGASVWWTWIAPTNCIVRLHIKSSSGFRAQVGVYTGGAVSNLVQIANLVAGQVLFSAFGGTQYHFAVDNRDGGAAIFELDMEAGQPPSNDSFANATVIAGASATLVGSNVYASEEPAEPNHAGDGGWHSIWWTWTAPGSGTLLLDTLGTSYYNAALAVYTGGSLTDLTPVASTTSSRLVIQVFAGTTYHIAVDGRYDSGGVVVVNLDLLATPDNDEFAAATPIIGLSTTVNGYNYGATKELGEPNHAGSPGGSSVWWTWTAPTNWVVTVDTHGSTLYDTLLAVYSGDSVTSLSTVATGSEKTSFPAVAGSTYRIAVDSLYGQGFIVLNLNSVPPPPNDAFANRAVISGISNSVTGFNTQASKEPGEPNYAGATRGKSVWWTWTAPANGTTELDTIGSSFNTLLAVYVGSSISNLILVASDDDGGGNGASKLVFPTVAGVTYQIVVDGEGGAIALNLRQLLPVALPPVNVTYKGSWPGFRNGPAVDVQVAGNIAYVSLAGGGLLILDVTDTANPRHVGDVGFLGSGPLAIAGQYAYLGQGTNGMQVIDIRNPAQPAILASYQGLFITAIGSYRDHVFALNDAGALVVFDVTNPGRPHAIYTNYFLGGSEMVVRGDHAYVCGPGRLWILDLSTPAMPALAGGLANSGLVDSGFSALDVDRSYAYIARNDSLEIVDIRNPHNPTLVVRINGVSNGSEDSPMRIAVHDNTVYIGVGSALSVIDVSNPTAPRLRRMFFPKLTTGRPDPVGFGEALQISAIRPVGDRLYLAFGDNGLQIINVSNPADPFTEGHFYTYADARQITVSDNRAYLLNYPIGVQVLDITSSEEPRLLGTYPYPFPNVSTARAVSFKTYGPYQYISDSKRGLSVVDFANPSEPVLTAQLMTNENSLYDISISLDKDVLYVWTLYDYSSNLFRAFDLLNPAEPIEIWRCSAQRFEGLALEYDSPFWVENGFMYYFDKGLKVFDITISGNPIRIGSTSFPYDGNPSSIFNGDGTALRANFLGVTMYDVNSPFVPRVLGVVRTNSTTGVTAFHKHVVATDPNRLDVIDVSSPWNPTVVGSYPGTEFGGVVLAGNLAIVAQGRQGVSILDLGASFATAPPISLQPTPQRVLEGARVRFDVGASGTIPLSYQWQLNGNNLPGATNFALTLINVEPSEAGQYSVVVSNSVGVTISSNAELSVDVPPNVALTAPTSDAVFLEGGEINVMADARDGDTGSVAQVSFYVDGNLLGSFTNGPYSLIWSNVPGGTYVLTARATDNEGASTISEPVRVTVTNVQVFQFSQTNYLARESNEVVTVTVRRNAGDAATIRFFTRNATAFAIPQGGVGSYYATTNLLTFPLGVLSTNISIRIVNDLVNRGERQFVVQLADPSSGWQLAYPSNAYVTIIDDDPVTNNFADVIIPREVARGSLEVWLSPTNALGKWRFWWETDWRESGSTASNLVEGEYWLEFMPRSGFRQPDDAVVNIISTAGSRQSVTYLYTNKVSDLQLGGLAVRLLPSNVASATDAAARGQWRFLSEADTNWYGSGILVTNVPEGGHSLEFKPVPGYETPASELITVVANRSITYQASYVPLSTAVANGPIVLDSFRTITNNSFDPGTPFQFCGQIFSEAGYGSGFVVKPRTVLTAAHVVFDFASLSYASNVWWFFQRQRGEYEPLAQRARGWHVFEGYAAARTNDSDFAGSSIEARQLDVAALYFFEDAGAGGYGSYLISTTNNAWLANPSLKMLVGYPVENVPEINQGRMHRVGPFFDALEKVTDQVYRTEQIRSYAGNSGGPLCVVSTNSLGRPFFIPAGVYLGGSGETVVRVIDLDIVDLINRAENSSHGGTNSSSGGVIPISRALGARPTHPSYLAISGPPSALRLGGAWRISPTNYGSIDLQSYTNFIHESATLTVRDGFTIEVTNLPGFLLVAPPPIVLTEGAYQVLELYSVMPPALIYDRHLGLGLTGTVATAYSIESAPALSPFTAWKSNATVTLSAGINWVNGTAPTATTNRFYRAVWLSE